MTNREPVEDYEENPEVYERECLERIRNYYREPESQDRMRADAGREFIEAHLEDAYPFTKLVVLYRYLSERVPRRVDFPIWSDEWVYDAPTGKWRESPRAVIDVITTNLDEPGDPAN